MRAAASRTARNAASATGAGGPTKVKTVRWWSASECVSSKRTSATPRTASSSAAMVARSRPSLKLGTHSTSIGDRLRRGARAPSGARRLDVERLVEAVEHAGALALRLLEARHGDLYPARQGIVEGQPDADHAVP